MMRNSFFPKGVISMVLWGLLSSCEREATPTGPPQLLKMVVKGVPEKDIQIDEQTHQIEVIMPSSLPSLQITPTFQLTKGATVLNMPIDLRKVCPCLGQFSVSSTIALPLIVQRDDFRVLYQLTLKSKSPLKLIGAAQPIILQANLAPTPENPLNLFLPAENSFGNPRINAISVAKVGQGTNWIGANDACFNICPPVPNQLGISLYGYRGTGALTPGEYEVQLRLADGSGILKYPQPIILK